MKIKEIRWKEREWDLTGVGVHPFRETVCLLTVYRWLKNAVHFVESSAGQAPVGEAGSILRGALRVGAGLECGSWRSSPWRWRELLYRQVRLMWRASLCEIRLRV